MDIQKEHRNATACSPWPSLTSGSPQINFWFLSPHNFLNECAMTASMSMCGGSFMDSELVTAGAEYRRRLDFFFRASCNNLPNRQLAITHNLISTILHAYNYYKFRKKSYPFHKYCAYEFYQLICLMVHKNQTSK